MNQRIFILMLLTICSIHISAQTKINFRSADSLDFYLSINDQKVNNIACVSITLDEQPAGKMAVAMTFPSYPNLNFTQTLTLKKNTSVFFEVGSTKTGYKLNLVSESVYSPGQNNSTNVLVPQAVNSSDTQIDTLETSNKITIQEFDKLTAEVKETHFELKKLDKINSSLESRMLSVDQLRYLMALLDTEDSKLLLLSNLKYHIIDSDRLKNVSEDFFLQKNKDQANQIIAQ